MTADIIIYPSIPSSPSVSKCLYDGSYRCAGHFLQSDGTKSQIFGAKLLRDNPTHVPDIRRLPLITALCDRFNDVSADYHKLLLGALLRCGTRAPKGYLYNFWHPFFDALTTMIVGCIEEGMPPKIITDMLLGVPIGLGVKGWVKEMHRRLQPHIEAVAESLLSEIISSMMMGKEGHQRDTMSIWVLQSLEEYATYATSADLAGVVGPSNVSRPSAVIAASITRASGGMSPVDLVKWMVRHEDCLGPQGAGRLVDFLYRHRHRTIEVITQGHKELGHDICLLFLKFSGRCSLTFAPLDLIDLLADELARRPKRYPQTCYSYIQQRIIEARSSFHTSVSRLLVALMQPHRCQGFWENFMEDKPSRFDLQVIQSLLLAASTLKPGPEACFKHSPRPSMMKLSSTSTLSL